MSGKKEPTPEQYLAAVSGPRQCEAREVFEFIRSAVPHLEPFVTKGLIGFGKFEFKGKTGSAEWLMVGMAVNKASLSVYSCACNDKGLLAEQYATKLGKVSVGKSCIRFKKWSDVNQPALRKLLQESAKGRFGFR